MAEQIFYNEEVSLPFDIDAEQAVLGCVLLDPSCFSTVQQSLRVDFFYLKQHGDIFEAMQAIDTRGEGINPLVLLDQLKRNGVYSDADGKDYLYKLASQMPTISGLESYIRIVLEKHYLRSVIIISNEMIYAAGTQEGDAESILDMAEQKIYDLRQGKSISAPSKLKDILINDVYDLLKKLNSPERESHMGIPTGFSDLDNVLVGFGQADLILLGARPAMGKTSFALNVAKNMAINGRRKILFFSLEMTKEQIAQRVLSSDSAISSKKLRNGTLNEDDWKNIAEVTATFHDAELYFDDSSNITVSEMKAKTRRLGNVDCVFVDYLGLINSGEKSESRVTEVTRITRNLKLMAKDLGIPVFVCAQLSRGPEGRGKSHRPQLSDLRESGSIEQDADIVLLLYRESYYNTEDDDKDDMDDEKIVKQDEIDVIVAKNRHGETATIKFRWDGAHTRFLGLKKD